MFFKILPFLLVAITTTSATDPLFNTSGVYLYDSDKALIGYVIKTLKKTMEPDCITACEETMACFSINFYKDQEGGNTCELSRSNKIQNPNAVVSKQGYRYAQPGQIKFCYKNQCQVKQALPDDWYKIGNSSFKIVPKKKSRSDSRQQCQALGGDLATINNELENKFIFGLVLTPLLLTTELSVSNTLGRLDILKSLVMDGKDTDLSLYNGASIVTEDNVPALRLDGTDDYADFPRFEIQNTDFTMTIWIKTPVPDSFQIIFNDYDSPDDNSKAIRLYGYEKQLRLRLYFPSYKFYCYSQGDIPGNIWTHLAITWKKDHTSCKVYFDGNLDIENTGSYSTESLRVTPNQNYIFGKKRSDTCFFNGWMRHFFIFSRVLTLNQIREVKDLFIRDAWIGLDDVITEGTMQWSDGSPLTYLPGSQSDLSNTADKDCSVMKEGNNGEWKMEDCSKLWFFICKK